MPLGSGAPGWNRRSRPAFLPRSVSASDHHRNEFAEREARFLAAETQFEKYGIPPLDDETAVRIEAEWRGEAATKKEAAAASVRFTFDTGMLSALERRKRRAWDAFRAIVRRGLVPVVPAVVCVEWWRGGVTTVKRFSMPRSSREWSRPSSRCP